MKPRVLFLLATLGLAFVPGPAGYLSIANGNDSPTNQDSASEVPIASPEKREIAAGDTIFVTITGEASVTLMGVLGQVPHDSDHNLELIVPMQVRRVDKDSVQLEHAIKLHSESAPRRLELECTLASHKITHEIVTALQSLPGNPQSSIPAQTVRSRLSIRNFDECLSYRIQLWDRIGEIAK